MSLKKLFIEKRKELLPAFICLILFLILIILPTGYEGAVIYKGTDRCQAEVLSVNNDTVIDTGLIRSGEQTCEIKLLGGRFKGQVTSGYNALNGSLEADKIFKEGDRALVVIDYSWDTILSVNMIDHYRLNKEIILVLCFALFLILVAGKTGARAILSFAITVLLIWKVLIPSYLNGYNPIYVGLAVTLMIIVITLSLVYGFDRKMVSAVSGSALGMFVTCILGVIFTKQFLIHGAIMSNSESLLYSGYQNLNLTQVFMASIFIGASGAVMDLAVDITSAVNEVVQKKPEISWREAAMSGFNVGRAAMGTMTTTLLLAYSGGSIALIMVFMAQGTPIYNILNYKYVSAEIIEIIVGSFGLVSVGPFTALTSGLLLTVRGNNRVYSDRMKRDYEG
ncbi:YibE/F family protein [Desulfosporosinus fructosivorans]|uniref:YibE/F family protein n=1 Tax=Desulfosporosinus fructosivorans TaxID=2018669 RepID=A0A4Z0R264_9FIRM|nr:YibE/F family protein [Desulfosporosinus fructosivorans]TGE35716.1 YibE/F family protein [Desulfosporosinus fructosivorans]